LIDSDDAATDTCYSPFSSPASTIGCQGNEIDLTNELNQNHAVLYQSTKSDLGDNYYELGIYQGAPLVPYTPPLHSPLNSQSPSQASSEGVNAASASHHLVHVGFSPEETSGFNSFMTPVMQRPLSTPFHQLKVYVPQPEPMDTSTPKADPTYFDSPHNLPTTSTPSTTITQNEVDDDSLFRTPIQREQLLFGQSPAYASSLVVTPSSQRKQVRFTSPAEDMEIQFRSKRNLYTPLPKPQEQDKLPRNGNHETSTSLPMHDSSLDSPSKLIISSPDTGIVSILSTQSQALEQKENFPISNAEIQQTILHQNKDREKDGTPLILQIHHDALQLVVLPTPSKDQEVANAPIVQTQQAALQQDDLRAKTDDHPPSQSKRSSSSGAPFPANSSRNPTHFMFPRGLRPSHNNCRCRKVKIIREVVRTIKVRDVGTQTSP